MTRSLNPNQGPRLLYRWLRERSILRFLLDSYSPEQIPVYGSVTISHCSVLILVPKSVPGTSVTLEEWSTSHHSIVKVVFVPVYLPVLDRSGTSVPGFLIRRDTSSDVSPHTPLFPFIHLDPNRHHTLKRNYKVRRFDVSRGDVRGVS